MPLAAVGFGLVLMVIGFASYFGTGTTSPTALIPAAFGLPLLLLGLLAMKERLRKHAMHAAAALALIGFIAPAAMAFPKLPTLISAGKVERADGSDATTAVILQLVLAAICAMFLGLCINSFIAVRRARRQSAT